MKDNDKNKKKQSLTVPLLAFVHQARRYASVSFFMLVAVAYGFIIVQINTLASSQVSQAEVTAKVKASPSPRIDLQAGKQLETLKDNSVNVQTLFEQSRTNPFQE